MSEMSDRLLEWCKMIDRRLWQSQHTLRHFCYPPTTMNVKMKGISLDEGPKGGVLKEQIVHKLEEAGFDLWFSGALSSTPPSSVASFVTSMWEVANRNSFLASSTMMLPSS